MEGSASLMGCLAFAGEMNRIALVTELRNTVTAAQRRPPPPLFDRRGTIAFRLVHVDARRRNVTEVRYGIAEHLTDAPGSR